ncbi:MAG: SH3 domain-containing protein [Mariprofundaceae bacterium]
MKVIKLCIVSVSLFVCTMLLEVSDANISGLTEAYAEVAGPVFKLRKTAKLHAAGLGASNVLELVWEGDVCVWLDKQGKWIQVRMKKTSHIGWIYYKYLMPASMQTSTGE